jgi:hypothetical protein
MNRVLVPPYRTKHKIPQVEEALFFCLFSHLALSFALPTNYFQDKNKMDCPFKTFAAYHLFLTVNFFNEKFEIRIEIVHNNLFGSFNYFFSGQNKCIVPLKLLRYTVSLKLSIFNEKYEIRIEIVHNSLFCFPN